MCLLRDAAERASRRGHGGLSRENMAYLYVASCDIKSTTIYAA